MPRGARRLPDACVRELAAAELIVHAGDFVTFEVLEQLREYAPVEAVHGNMDAPEVRGLLPETRVVQVGAARLGVVHDPGPRTGRAERFVTRFPGCAVVVYGHTHLPDIGRHRGVWLLNPGSPTERRRAPGHTMVRLTVDGDTFRPELLALS